ncbi:Arm DNA-binding domain-containing protein [Suttonella ornithocola]|uniref:Prophage CPS-53 integrase n=1 Tax=Suttonella ornithocola TaxID=279832 RepID=A0A380MMP8_9GAMM|nr:Arm DNA-binding domain-containing protein [Suttonella ornithocola]SUO93011.1 Putative prophage CPS-53 integrase [Suttonella ornithocola]
MKLTDKAIKHADSNGKKRLKLFDGGGLHLLITDKGAKYWRYRYRFNGEDCTLSIGTYPAISLKEARQKHRDAQTLLNQGINPHQQKKALKIENRRQIRQSVTFEHIAQEWYQRRKPIYSNAKAA